jgi:hypothetical protein
MRFRVQIKGLNLGMLQFTHGVIWKILNLHAGDDATIKGVIWKILNMHSSASL